MTALTEARMEEALHFLSNSDESLANLLADMERAEWRAKTTRHAVFVTLTGTIADREARASIHEQTEKAQSLYFDTVHAYNALRNKRATEQIIIDCWRSINASRNRGVTF